MEKNPIFHVMGAYHLIRLDNNCIQLSGRNNINTMRVQFPKTAPNALLPPSRTLNGIKHFLYTYWILVLVTQMKILSNFLEQTSVSCL